MSTLRPLHESQVKFDPDNKTESFTTSTKEQRQFRSLHWNQVNFDSPHCNHVYFNHPHTNQCNFDARTKPRHFDPNTKNKSISITHKKPSQSILTLERSHFRPAHNNPVNFGPHTKTKCMSINHTKDNSIPTPAMISSLFRSPPIKSSQSLPPTQKPSQFRCPD